MPEFHSHPSVPVQFLDWIDNAPDLYWSIDAQGRYTYLNRAWERLLGYRAEEMLGRSFADFQPEEEAGTNLARLRELAAAPAPIQLESLLRKKNGDLAHLCFHGRPIIEGGEFRGYSGMGFDFTAFRDTQSRLESSQRELETFIKLTPTPTVAENGTVLTLQVWRYSRYDLAGLGAVGNLARLNPQTNP